MVSVHSISARAADTAIAVRALEQEAAKLDASADFLCVFYDEIHADQLIHDFLAARFPGVPVLGGTSSGGTMTEKGLGGDGSIGMLVVADPDGEYGVGAAELSGDAADAGERALHLALDRAGCPGELPELIWIYQAPGQEEQVIAGLRRVVGDRCPIIGGSAADNAVAGHWRQLGPEGPMTNGVAVGALFSSGGISFAFQGGYEPTGTSGIVTRVSGRTILTIDGEPAATVYNRWSGGKIGHKLAGGNILMETTMSPLGIEVGRIGDVTHFLVIHPEQILENGAMSTFANIGEGSRLFSMRGDRTHLIRRAGRVATAAAAALPGGARRFAGGLVVYCAGCRFAVGEEMDQVSAAISQSFGGMPFVGCFTFGEQGQVLGSNAHGNLMISAIAFGR
ncbi:MAG: FIST C-terminal domain-containing protein [Betaproteobacteria bacterium]|nr:FIST C-terminal domain-containing protein [Betaproteobacteria bacterium]